MFRDETEAYHELCAYTLQLRDREFIHQHVVDTWFAQHADENSKPIGVAFSLIGLYLHLEKNFTGKQVQNEHIRLARVKRPWPKFDLPAGRGSVTATDVMAAPAGLERRKAIDAWCASVWEAYSASHARVAALLR